MSEAGATRADQAMRAAIVGVSQAATCGVRDHAVLLAQALGERGASCSMHWLGRSEHSLRGARAEFHGWAGSLAGELHRARPSAIVFHYSVFSYSHRGFPLYVRQTIQALRRSRIPVISVLHEIA